MTGYLQEIAKSIHGSMRYFFLIIVFTFSLDLLSPVLHVSLSCESHPFGTGGFPLSRNFYLGMHGDKIKAMYYEVSRVNIKVERGSTFTLLATSHTLPLFTYRGKIYVRTHVKVMRQWKSTLMQREF